MAKVQKTKMFMTRETGQQGKVFFLELKNTLLAELSSFKRKGKKLDGLATMKRSINFHRGQQNFLTSFKKKSPQNSRGKGFIEKIKSQNLTYRTLISSQEQLLNEGGFKILKADDFHPKVYTLS